MNTWVCIAALLGPLAHLAMAFAAERPGPLARHLRLSRFVALFALASSMVAAFAVFAGGSTFGQTLGVGGVGAELLLDRLSVTFALLITGIGTVVLAYSRRYLSGDASHAAFIGRLHATLGMTTLLSYSGNVFQLVFFWCLTSLALHRVLFFYRDRPRVVFAAARKFRMARTGDVMLLTAAVLLYREFGTANLTDIARQAGMLSTSWDVNLVAVAGLLLVGAASLKSGQVPNHVWLPEVVEAPTPVSALLHAGIVNGGGFLMLRFADVVGAGAVPCVALLAIGGVSAVWGALSMLAKPSVKEALAYSTVSQMGLMMFECGLGAYDLAVLHIVAHSAYKAHAFLSAGQLRFRAAETRKPDSLLAFTARWALSFGFLLVGQNSIHGADYRPEGATWVLHTMVASAMALGSAVHIDASLSGVRAALARGTAVALVIVGLGGGYLIVETLAHLAWGDGVATGRPAHPLVEWMGGAFSLVFAAVAFAQTSQLHQRKWTGVQRLYVHAKGDFYARAWFERCWGWNLDLKRNSDRTGQPIVAKSAYQEL